jgi:dienelactone hydrolase
VQAYAAGHPSALSTPGDFADIDPNLPGFYQLEESDIMVSEKTRGQIEELTKDMNFKIKMYPGTKHGFCLKSNEDNEKARNIVAEAANDAADFFTANM